MGVPGWRIGPAGAPDHLTRPLARPSIVRVITFRPLTRDDLPLLSHWLAEPLVHRWWHDDASPAAVEREYGPCIDGAEPTEVFVVGLDGEPVGIIQRYAIAAYPADAAQLARILAVPPDALSIDYLVGEPSVRGRGVGAALIAAFVERTWADVAAAREVLVPVAAGNRASWRSLEEAGFTRVAEGAVAPDNPVDPPDHVLYLRRR